MSSILPFCWLIKDFFKEGQGGRNKSKPTIIRKRGDLFNTMDKSWMVPDCAVWSGERKETLSQGNFVVHVWVATAVNQCKDSKYSIIPHKGIIHHWLCFLKKRLRTPYETASVFQVAESSQEHSPFPSNCRIHPHLGMNQLLIIISDLPYKQNCEIRSQEKPS